MTSPFRIVENGRPEQVREVPAQTKSTRRNCAALGPAYSPVPIAVTQDRHAVPRFQCCDSSRATQMAQCYERGLHKHLESDSGKVLRSIVDPYSYRQLLTQPKLIIIGTNDHYWPLDALNLYWSDLAGEKHILYVPNNGHGLNDLLRLSGSLNAFHQSAVTGTPLPRLSWDFENGNATMGLRIKSDQPPQDVRVWIASSKTRDFRQAHWTSKQAEANEGTFVHSQPIPVSGYTAIFGEAEYESDRVPYFLSTNVKIVKSRRESAE